jgi:hypothetical protein
VATAAYSYHGSRRAATRIARRISGPPKVGTGELSRMVRKNSPSAPRWRNVERNERPGFAFWSRVLNMAIVEIRLPQFSRVALLILMVVEWPAQTAMQLSDSLALTGCRQ